MNKDDILTMDPYILFSLINMKLRDDFSDLDDLCANYDIEVSVLKNKLKEAGYIYSESNNQFISL